MKLTRIQRKFLKVYMAYHKGGLTFTQVMRDRWPRVVLFVVVGLCSHAFLVPAHAELGWSVFGICAGLFYSEIRGIGTSKEIWPVFDRVIDWEQVGHMIDLPEDGKA